MSDTSGPASGTLFAWYDLDECCWRTSQATFLSGSDLFSETWPRSGMTRSGCAYELPMPALHTGERESSSSLPTPRATRGGSATETVALLPTPEAKLSDSGPDYARATRAGSGGDDLTTTVHKTLMGTPRSVLWKAGTMEATREAVERHGRNGRLEEDVALLPTPTAQAAKHGTDDRGPGTLDDFNLWSLATRPETFSGEPTSALSAAGSASRDGQPPDLLSLLAEERSA